MKKKHFAVRTILLLITCCGVIMLFSNEAYAASNSYKKIKSGSYYLEGGETYEIPFSTAKKAIFVMDIEIDDCNNPSEGGLQVILKKNGSEKKYRTTKYRWKISQPIILGSLAMVTFRNPGIIHII